MAKKPPEMTLESASGPESLPESPWVGSSLLMVAALPFVLDLAGDLLADPPPLLDEVGQTEGKCPTF